MELFLLILAALTVVAVVLLKGFDRIAGRGPKQVRDGVDQSTLGGRAPGRVPCPHCAELIMPAAKKCPYCRSDLARG